MIPEAISDADCNIAKHRRHHVERRDLLPGHQVEQVARVLVTFGFGDHQSCTGSQCRPELPDREVEVAAVLSTIASDRSRLY